MSRDDPSHAPSKARRPQPSGLQDFARSLGVTLGLVRRFVPQPRPLGRLAPKARKPSATTLELLRMRKELLAGAAELEAQLERLHDRITTGVAPQGGGAAAVGSLVEKARRLREQLDEKRDELVRIERHLAREQRLKPAVPAGAAAKEQPARPESEGRADDQTLERETQRKQRARRIAEHAKLGDRYSERTLARLAEALFDEDPHIRRESTQRLAEFGGRYSVQLLDLALRDPHERVRLGALNALSLIEGPRRVETFRRFLDDGSAMIRLAALRGLSGLGRELKRADLVAALEDSDPRVRHAAAGILGARRDGKALHALTFSLSDDDPAVRAAAAEALGNLNDDRAVLALLKALTDEAPEVREVVRWALRTIAGDEIEGVALELEGEARVAALKQWWREARVTALIERNKAAEPIIPLQTTPAVTAAQRAIATRVEPRRERAAAAEQPVAAPAPQARPKPASEPPEPQAEEEEPTFDAAIGEEAREPSEIAAFGEEEAGEEEGEEESLLDAAPPEAIAKSAPAPERKAPEKPKAAEPPPAKAKAAEPAKVEPAKAEPPTAPEPAEAKEQAEGEQFEDLFGGGDEAEGQEGKKEGEEQGEGEGEDEDYESVI